MSTNKITWECPSNIALVKYWGKHGVQLPRNPSISFTLSTAKSITTLEYTPKTTTGYNFQFFFEGKENPKFKEKIVTFFDKILPEFPLLEKYSFKIYSENTFPHSSGIASSASAMGALSLCLCSLDETLKNDKVAFLKRASYLSRIGSGSACRSLYPYLGQWGKTPVLADSSDEYAIPYYDTFNPIFKTFHDSILIASSGEKSVSSRAGHELMNTNRFAAERFRQAFDNIEALIKTMQTGDLDAWGAIVEEEALTLHALMMTSNPGYILMRPSTLEMIEKIRAYRAETKLPVYFTLDAGPNIHLLYPDSCATEVKQFIESELKKHCENGTIIYDKVGEGPSLIS